VRPSQGAASSGLRERKRWGDTVRDCGEMHGYDRKPAQREREKGVLHERAGTPMQCNGFGFRFQVWEGTCDDLLDKAVDVARLEGVPQREYLE